MLGCHVFVLCFSLVEKLTVGEKCSLSQRKKIFLFSLYHSDNDKNCHLILRHFGAHN